MLEDKPMEPERERHFWEFVEKNSQQVAKWPDWMKGGRESTSSRAALETHRLSCDSERQPRSTKE
jgi:hypothetical protein